MLTNSCTSRLDKRRQISVSIVDSSWNVMTHGDAREGKWRGNWRIEWVASTLHTTSEHGVSSITTADAHTSAASSRLNWRPRGFKWARPFRRKTKSGFCACANTFQMASTEGRVGLRATLAGCGGEEQIHDPPRRKPAVQATDRQAVTGVNRLVRQELFTGTRPS